MSQQFQGRGGGGSIRDLPRGSSISIAISVDKNTSLGPWEVSVDATTAAGTSSLGQFSYARATAADLASRWIATAWLPGAIAYEVSVSGPRGLTTTLLLAAGVPMMCPGIALIEDP